MSDGPRCRCLPRAFHLRYSPFVTGTNGRRHPAACLAALALFAAACSEAEAPSVDAPGEDLFAWAEVLAFEPDPAVIADADWRARITATGLPWRVRERTSGAELLLVPPGEFERGARDDDTEAFDDERPRHPVRVSAPFYLGRTELTRGEWQRVMQSDESVETRHPERPIGDVTRFEVQEFLARTELDLPTESEWEYACRAGDARPRHGELDDIAWHRGNAQSYAHAVASKSANALGFHDVLGNVWEWTSTWYVADEYARCTGGVDASAGPRLGTVLALRGGSWYDAPSRVRASARYGGAWSFSAGHVGFRVAKHLAPEPRPAR